MFRTRFIGRNCSFLYAVDRIAETGGIGKVERSLCTIGAGRFACRGIALLPEFIKKGSGPLRSPF